MKCRFMVKWFLASFLFADETRELAGKHLPPQFATGSHPSDPSHQDVCWTSPASSELRQGQALCWDLEQWYPMVWALPVRE